MFPPFQQMMPHFLPFSNFLALCSTPWLSNYNCDCAGKFFSQFPQRPGIYFIWSCWFMYVHIFKKAFPDEFYSVVIFSFLSNSINFVFFASITFLGCYTVSSFYFLRFRWIMVFKNLTNFLISSEKPAHFYTLFFFLLLEFMFSGITLNSIIVSFP